MWWYLDAYYAGDMVTCRDINDFVNSMKLGPIDWFSKNQGFVETSTFIGSTVGGTKSGSEANHALRYWLWMMVVLIGASSFVVVNIMSVVKNVSIPASMLKKKSNSIAYHEEWELSDRWCVMQLLVISLILSGISWADITTKVLPSGGRRLSLIEG